MLIVIAIVVILLFSLILLPLILIRLVPRDPCQLKGNCLLVTAHPDDECLFFAPVLLSARENIYILCLSNGNNHRSDELRRSCFELGVKDYQIIDDQIHLKDEINKSWSPENIIPHVQRCVRRWNISTLISFDSYGVSGHKNHSSIYHALSEFNEEDRQIQFLSLESVSIFRKYSSLFEFIRLFFPSNKTESAQTFVLPVQHCFTPHKSMFQHRSQLVWFRYFYLAFSRYIWINDLKLIYWTSDFASSRILTISSNEELSELTKNFSCLAERSNQQQIDSTNSSLLKFYHWKKRKKEKNVQKQNLQSNKEISQIF